MQHQDNRFFDLAVVKPSEIIVRSDIAASVLDALERDRTDDAERNAVIDRLSDSIRDQSPIDLAAPRSKEAAEYDGESPTAGGYLLGLIRDKFLVAFGEDWRQFIALGSLAVGVEAALAQA